MTFGNSNASDIFESRLKSLLEAGTQILASSYSGKMLKLADTISTAIRDGHKLYVFGNGGSAMTAGHLAAEFVGRLKDNRRPLPAFSLSDSSANLTAIANDYGYESTFARQLRALGEGGDVAIAISTSGTSPNVLSGAETARGLDMHVAAFTGTPDSPLSDIAHTCICIPADDLTVVQEYTLHLCHSLVAAVEVILVQQEGF